MLRPVPVLERALEAPVQSFEDALRVGATHRYLADRKRAHELAQSRQMLLLDCEPEELPVGLVNKYLEIKRAGLL